MRHALSEYRRRLMDLDLTLPPPAGAAGRPGPPRLEEASADSAQREISALWRQVESRRARRAARGRLVSRALVAAIVAAVGVAGALLPRRPRAFPVRSVPFPALSASGLAIAAGAFLSLDAETGDLVELNPGGARPLRVLRLPVRATGGLAAAPGSLWTADVERRRLYRHDPISGKVLEEAASPGPRPAALAWDGAALWSVDAAARRLYRHDSGAGLPVVGEWPLGEERPAALAAVDGLLWIAGARAPVVTRYRPGADAGPVDAADLGGFLPPGSRIVGLAADLDDTVWVMTVSPSRLTRIPAGALRFQ